MEDRVESRSGSGPIIPSSLALPDPVSIELAGNPRPLGPGIVGRDAAEASCVIARQRAVKALRGGNGHEPQRPRAKPTLLAMSPEPVGGDSAPPPTLLGKLAVRRGAA